MDKYLIDDYNRERAGQTEVAKRKRLKVLELYLHGIDKKEIAEILEVDVSTINSYFQWLRINGFITEEQEQEIEANRKLELERIKEKNSSRKILTANRAKKLADERDRQILKLHNEGFTLQKISEKLNLTLVQAKERFFALGISIYTEQELEQMKSADRDEGENWDPIDKNAKKALSTSNPDQKIAKADGVEVSDEEENPNYFDMKDTESEIVEDRDLKRISRNTYAYDEDGKRILISSEVYGSEESEENEDGTRIHDDNLISETTYEYPSSDVQVEIVKTKDEDGEDTYEVNVKDGQLTPAQIDMYNSKYGVEISAVNKKDTNAAYLVNYIVENSSDSDKNDKLKEFFNDRYSVPSTSKSSDNSKASASFVKDVLYNLDIQHCLNIDVESAVSILTSAFGSFDAMIDTMTDSSSGMSNVQQSIYLSRVAQLMERYEDIKKD